VYAITKMKSNYRTNETRFVLLQTVEVISGTGQVSVCKKGKNNL